MSLDFLKPQPLPAAGQAPTSNDASVEEARRRARLRASSSGRRGTVLGGRSGGGETVARKSLLGE